MDRTNKTKMNLLREKTKLSSNRVINLSEYLPDEILGHILSFLKTKEAVKTSILTKRWDYLWRFNSTNDLNDPAYESQLARASII